MRVRNSDAEALARWWRAASVLGRWRVGAGLLAVPFLLLAVAAASVSWLYASARWPGDVEVRAEVSSASCVVYRRGVVCTYGFSAEVPCVGRVPGTAHMSRRASAGADFAVGDAAPAVWSPARGRLVLDPPTLRREVQVAAGLAGAAAVVAVLGAVVWASGRPPRQG